MFPHPGLTLAIPIISPTPLQSFLLLTRSIMSGSKRALAGVLFLGMGLLCLGPVAPVAGQGKRLPVPAANDMARSETLIKDVFGEEMSKAKTQEALAKLATEMLKHGDDTPDDEADNNVIY